MYVVDFYNQIAVHNDTRGPAHGARNAATRPDRDHHFTRLWRIQQAGRSAAGVRARREEPAGLVEMLDHPNGWVRATANRLLSEGAGTTALTALETKASSGKTAYGRMGALWVLHNLGRDNPDLLLAAAGDNDLVLRKTALRIAAETDHTGVDLPADLLRARLNDPQPRTHFLRRPR